MLAVLRPSAALSLTPHERTWGQFWTRGGTHITEFVHCERVHAATSNMLDSTLPALAQFPRLGLLLKPRLDTRARNLVQLVRAEAVLAH